MSETGESFRNKWVKFSLGYDLFFYTLSFEAVTNYYVPVCSFLMQVFVNVAVHVLCLVLQTDDIWSELLLYLVNEVQL